MPDGIRIECPRVRGFGSSQRHTLEKHKWKWILLQLFFSFSRLWQQSANQRTVQRVDRQLRMDLAEQWLQSDWPQWTVDLSARRGIPRLQWWTGSIRTKRLVLVILYCFTWSGVCTHLYIDQQVGWRPWKMLWSFSAPRQEQVKSVLWARSVRRHLQVLPLPVSGQVTSFRVNPFGRLPFVQIAGKLHILRVSVWIFRK